MKVIWLLAKNTYREIIRDRILYGLIVFALLLVGFSLALGQLSFTEQARISGNFGFAGIHLSSMILAIFIGASLVAKEIDKKTIMTLLVRPMTRLQFILGKCLGLSFVIGTVIVGLALVLALVFHGLGLEIYGNFLKALWGIFLEALLLLGVAMFFSSFSRPVMVVSFSVGIFLIGHWINNLNFFAEKSESESFRSVAAIVTEIMPNLENFNWRDQVLEATFNPSGITSGTIYALSWFGVCTLLTAFIIRRKDFG
ncbi:MAG: ABC transporter permease subunit [Bdellovibrionales bacterium]